MLSVLFAATALVASSPPGPVVFAPFEGEIEHHPCDPRPCLLARPQRAHAYSGSFSVRFWQQPQCIRAPCGRASTAISLPDGTTLPIRRIAYARGTPAALKLAFDSAHPLIRYEGKVWITIGDAVAIIAPTSATLANRDDRAANTHPAQPHHQPQ